MKPDMKKPIPKLNNKGYSIVEVLVSIVLIALLASFVAVFMLFWQNVRAQSNMLTEALNLAQRGIESKYDIYSVLINNNQTDEFDDEEVTEIECNIFNRSLKVYAVKETFNMQELAKEYFDNFPGYIPVEDEHITLVRGIAYSSVAKPPIPQIESVTINANGSEVDVIYFADESSYASVSLPIKMKDSTNFHKHLYQWYEAFDRFHVLPLKGESMVGEGSVVPSCPYDFNFISGANDMTLHELGKYYKGKIIACLVIPGSVHGYMGDSVVSNYIYVSPLPRLNSGKYYALYDASLISYKDEAILSSSSDGVRRGIKENISSELVYNKDNIQLQHSRDTVYLNIIGDNTGLEDENQSTTTYTRYLEYRGGAYSRTTERNFSSSTEIYAFAVFKPAVDEDDPSYGEPFLKYLTRSNGRYTETSLLSNAIDVGNSNRGWQIKYTSVTVRNRTTFELGGTDVNIAELILVENPAVEEINWIVDYLKDKYDISSVSIE